MKLKRATLLCSIVLISILAISSSCAVAPPVNNDPYIGNSEGVKVAIIGDSLSSMDFAGPYLKQNLEPSFRLWLAATPGREIDGRIEPNYNVSPENEIMNTDPQIVVIELGTNDAWFDITTEHSLASYQTLVSKFPNACLVGVTVNEQVPAEQYAYRNDRAHAINQALPSMVDLVLDWDGIAQEFLPPPPESDYVHPNVAGREALANLITQGVLNCNTASPPS